MLNLFTTSEEGMLPMQNTARCNVHTHTTGNTQCSCLAKLVDTGWHMLPHTLYIMSINTQQPDGPVWTKL